MVPTGVFFMSSNIRPLNSNAAPVQTASQFEKRARPFWGEKLTRNTMIAVCALLTVVGLRQSTVSGASVLHVMQDIIESEWDENVGRLSYVGSTWADSLQVFASRSSLPEPLTCPVSAPAFQPWSPEAPYLLYSGIFDVFAAADGEVMQIAHDDQEKYILRLSHGSGLETVYFGLDRCAVSEGDTVSADTMLGISGDTLAFEIRQNGKPIDCSSMIAERAR